MNIKSHKDYCLDTLSRFADDIITLRSSLPALRCPDAHEMVRQDCVTLALQAHEFAMKEYRQGNGADPLAHGYTDQDNEDNS